MNTQPNTPASLNEAVAQCPTCKAPCTTTVNMRGGEYGWGTTDAERTVYRYEPSPPASAPFQKALDIRIAQGWQLGGNACPVLYTDTINGEQVCRDDLWIATTAGLKGSDAVTLSEALSPATVAQPVDMVLHCPKCGLQHIDRPDEVDPYPTPEKDAAHWANPSHKSHLCRTDDGGCGHIWRPADVPTNGVQAVTTIGKADSPVAQPCASQGCGGAVNPEATCTCCGCGGCKACLSGRNRCAKHSPALSTAPRSLDGATPGGKA
jgi:hypothetical protein